MERSFIFLFLWLSSGALDAEANEMKTVSVMGDFNTYLPIPTIDRKYRPCSQRSSRTKCVLECSAKNAPNVTLTWYNGSSIFSIIKISDLSIDPSLCLEVEHQDKNTYSCVLNNPFRNHTTHLDITQFCQPCSPISKTQVPVEDGSSVTLQNHFKNIQDQILWLFGSREIFIAEILKKQVDIFGYDNETFIDRLGLDSTTGDLTIKNISKEISGVYKLQINNNISTCWSFNVTVWEPLPSPQISNHSKHCSSSGSKCALECSVENLTNVTNVTLSWYKGDSLVSSISVSDVNYSCLYLDYKDNGNYSCVVSNSFINETKYLIISELCSAKCLDTNLEHKEKEI
ncbi:carcinoembryonic antigen-related cell adhesion molecule 20 [Pseudorasbora parva]|uniref:carcinoembryonic antigen-related cell adhesion molecule 20 n=1 Tax=Pseudorasbora parva TaxID=51549 RepID=UPI00351EB50A